MRLNHEVTFYYAGGKTYDPVTSTYSPNVTQVTTRMASVTDTGTNRTIELFGNLDTRTQVVRIVEPVGTKWTYLTIDGGSDKYAPVTKTEPLQNCTIIVTPYSGAEQ